MADASDERSPIRVLLAVGNPERERRLRDALSGDGLVVAARCLDGPSLVERAAAMDIDVALASSDLHRLSAATMAAVREARLPLVLLAEPGDVERFAGLAHLVPAGAAAEEVVAALREATVRGPVYSGMSSPGGSEEGAKDVAGDGSGGEDGAGQVVAVVSGKGAPGKTTVAIGVAAALGDRGRRVVLVDADLRGGNVGPHLDLDPRRGLLGLAFGGNGASENARIEEELEEGPGFAVLTGIERPESRSSISTELLTGAVATLREQFEYVVVDAGEAIAGIPSPATDALLRAADRVLVLAAPDLVALWNARAAVRHLREGLGMAPEAVSVILNRREARGQYNGEEVERALGAPVLAAVPEERRAARRAMATQLPITAVGGRAARELRALAGRLTAAPAPAAPARRRRWMLPFSRAGVGAR
ncbi:MAG: P-loop NTPase [Dehalococcoidia bacterium]|nr:P-loop NTPase [Dehalococcoidia bacterium]